MLTRTLVFEDVMTAREQASELLCLMAAEKMPPPAIGAKKTASPFSNTLPSELISGNAVVEATAQRRRQMKERNEAIDIMVVMYGR